MINLGITPLGWAVIIMSVFIGIVGGYFIFKRFPNLLGEDRKIKKVIKNPHLLVEKLKAHGEIYDNLEDGRRVEIDFKVGLDDKTGKEVLIVERKEPVKKLKEMKEKSTKKKIKPKKKVKKKVKKKNK